MPIQRQQAQEPEIVVWIVGQFAAPSGLADEQNTLFRTSQQQGVQLQDLQQHPSDG
jgi:hypothetical protein